MCSILYKLLKCPCCSASKAFVARWSLLARFGQDIDGVHNLSWKLGVCRIMRGDALWIVKFEAENMSKLFLRVLWIKVVKLGGWVGV